MFEDQGIKPLSKSEASKMPLGYAISEFVYTCRDQRNNSFAVFYGNKINPDIYTEHPVDDILEQASATHRGQVVVFSEKEPTTLVTEVVLGVIRDVKSLEPPTTFFFDSDGNYNFYTPEEWFTALESQAGATYSGETYTWSEVTERYINPSDIETSEYFPNPKNPNVLINVVNEEEAPWWLSCFYANADNPIKKSFDTHKGSLELGEPHKDYIKYAKDCDHLAFTINQESGFEVIIDDGIEEFTLDYAQGRSIEEMKGYAEKYMEVIRWALVDTDDVSVILQSSMEIPELMALREDYIDVMQEMRAPLKATYEALKLVASVESVNDYPEKAMAAFDSSQATVNRLRELGQKEKAIVSEVNELCAPPTEFH